MVALSVLVIICDSVLAISSVSLCPYHYYWPSVLVITCVLVCWPLLMYFGVHAISSDLVSSPLLVCPSVLAFTCVLVS